jgi:zinc protease
MANESKLRILLLQATLLWSATSALNAQSVVDVNVDIPYRKTVLKNGLTVIVHEDHKAPIVAVNLWYHVGSKNEKPGKTGFAHLFEHLMFTGSENFKGTGDQRAFFETMERLGATAMNGTTDNDRTDYFENVPKNAIDVALWLESDRMGHLLGAIDKNKLDVQRGVVQNEKRLGENRPYGVTHELLTKGMAPPGHPYSWTVIGSMEDLNAASMEDIQDWFKTYYGPANTVLVLAGDIDAATAFQKAEQYFGEIPAGPPVGQYEKWIPRIPGTRRQRVADRVPQARLYKGWSVPAYGEPEQVYLELVGDVLSSGKSSRLYKRLVYDDQLATDVSVTVRGREIASEFIITATARPDVDLAKVEKAVDEELSRFLAQGPTAQELQRAKAGRISGFVRGAERIGGFGGKSDILAMNQTYRGDPEYYKVVLDLQRRATEADLLNAAKKWLTPDVYILEVHPYPAFETVAGKVDRARLPQAGSPPDVQFPALQRFTLANGLKLILAERHASAMVQFTMKLDAGYASDQFAVPGTARLATSALNEGTTRRTALQISDELAALGADLSADAALDTCNVSLSTLRTTLDQALDVYTDVILNPVFPQTGFRRLQKELLAAIQQERMQPFAMALRVFPGLLYGHGHAYGNSFTGSGTEATVASLTDADMKKFHQTWFKANHATLIVVGDTTLNELTPKVERLFGSWQPGDVPTKNISPVPLPKTPAVYLVDRPGSLQSVIFVGNVAPPKSDPAEIAMDTMDTILGGAFSSRLNLNLREEKHWCYGAFSFIQDARGQRPFIALAPVQTDKTKESMIEVDKELRAILGRKPITAEELAKAQDNQTLTLPGSWETIGAVSGSIDTIVTFGLPDDYYARYPGKVRALTLDDLTHAAQEVIHPDNLVWVVVGDRGKIEPGVRELGWGEVHLIDADGHPVK